MRDMGALAKLLGGFQPNEAVKKLGQAPSRPPIFQGFRRFRSEPVPFFHSLNVSPPAKGCPMR